MNEGHNEKVVSNETNFSRQVAAQVARKQNAQRGIKKSVWFGLGMSGLIGWTVTVPALIGVALGIWVDKRYPSMFSWTLMLLLLGVVLGCLNAWHWVGSESKAIQEDSNG